MNIVLAGFGQEGRASYDYWSKDDNVLTIADECDSLDGLPGGARTILGVDAFSKLSDFDLIIRSPSVNPKKLPYGEKVWSATNEFFANCPADIIGVTGTKGKGTTSSLIASILTAAGKTVHLVGNIGTPALAELSRIESTDIVVFELSSFQLWDLKKSPRIAVVLGIEPEHLDVHDDMQDYVNAKANIRRYQTLQDECIYHPTNVLSRQVAETPLKNVDLERYGGSGEFAHRYGVKDDNEVYVEDGFFRVQDRNVCSVDHLKIPGQHNIENACAAMSAVTDLWADVPDSAFAQGLESFMGLPHRIKFIREVDDVIYYDDSYSSAPAASIAAIRSFDAPKIVILGGYDRQNSFDELALAIKQTPTVKKVLLMGQTKNKIQHALMAANVETTRIEMIHANQLSDVVRRAHEIAEPGDIVILSPGCASFDMFKNFTDRGEQFIKEVNAL